MTPRVVLCLAVAAIGFLPGCDGVVDTGTGYTSVTLTHQGFDFSAGAIPSDWDASDGHTTNWPGLPAINPDKAYGPYVWFTPFANTETESFTKDMGAVALESVTTVPATWDAGAAQVLEPLSVGHVYVVKCRDGYAKFLVNAVHPEQEFVWSVDVEYAFTSTATFDH